MCITVADRIIALSRLSAVVVIGVMMVGKVVVVVSDGDGQLHRGAGEGLGDFAPEVREEGFVFVLFSESLPLVHKKKKVELVVHG